MYLVTINNDGQETVIHDPNVNDLKLDSGTIKTEINKIDTFNLSMYLNNPGYGHMRAFQTFIEVLNMKTGEKEFKGRVHSTNDDMTDSGLHSTSFICAGELHYLHDSQQRHMEWRGRPEDLFISILEYHNQQVEDYKRFEPGVMEVTNNTDNLYLYLSAEEDTWETLKEKLIDNIGGELQIREENGVRYLDYLERVGTDRSTEIRIAKNLRSMSRDIDPLEIITRLTPLGERIESEDEEATDASEARLTIEDVNDGTPYLDDEAKIAEFGIRGGHVTWDDVTLPENLLSNGQSWLANQKTALVQYEISAADLSLIGLDIDTFNTGDTYPLINPIMNIDSRLRVVGKTTDINEPHNASLKIGDRFKTLRQYQNEANRAAERVVDLESKTNRQAQRLSVVRQQVRDVDDAVKQVEIKLDESDLPALETAISNLINAVSDLNETVDSIPIYEPATPSQDGLMSASDKSRLDSIQNATETLDGLLRSVDQVKLNRLSISQNIDLDQLYEDVEDLKNG